jgi:hypothetical protein
MNKVVVGLVVSVFVGMLAVANTTACNINPCGAGEAECNGGCMPAGNVCCGDGNCPAGDVCLSGDTCGSSLPPQVSSCESCLESGQECCANDDLTVDCAEVGRVCCGNHTSCPAGTVCSGTECLN